MNEKLYRIGAIIRADFLIRFRRTSTAVIFLLLCILAYLWIPDPSTGRAILQINEQRALNNSGALGMATATLCTVMMGLLGFYMVSNTLRRDVETRTGFIIASTTVKDAEYLGGKFLGNMVFLAAIVAGFFVSCMIMQLLRGEAPLEPGVFAFQYLVLAPPMICAVSVFALLFESIRFLSGRFGDLVYFFVWMALLTIPAIQQETGAIQSMQWVRFTDPFGFLYMLTQVQAVTHTHTISIGASSFDATKPPFIFHGLTLPASWILPRIISALFTTPLLLLALFRFHRFNPTRLKLRGAKSKRSLLDRMNALVKPVARLFPSGMNPVFSEALLTLRLYPVALLLLSGLLLASVLTPLASLQHVVLPVIFGALTLVLSDIATREHSAGTTALLFAAPRLRQNYVWWKFSTTLLLTLLFTGVAAGRLLIAQPLAALSLLIGSCFITAAATALGLLSRNPKAFIVTFLLYVFMVLNDGGKTANFDFAGWYGTATFAVQLTYAGIAAVLLASAQVVHLWRLKRM